MDILRGSSSYDIKSYANRLKIDVFNLPVSRISQNGNNTNTTCKLHFPQQQTLNLLNPEAQHHSRGHDNVTPETFTFVKSMLSPQFVEKLWTLQTKLDTNGETATHNDLPSAAGLEELSNQTFNLSMT